MLRELAIRLNQLMGFNVIPLKNKKPLSEWERWHTEIQSKDDIDIMDWEHATGIGVIMGINDLASIDIDMAESLEVLELLLTELGLPNDYRWVVQSGSGNGFHIYFRSPHPSPLPKGEGVIQSDADWKRIGGRKTVYKFKMMRDGLCKHIELRLNDCQNAFPPSMHESGGMYDFYFNEPNEAPVYVDALKVIECIEKNCIVKPVTSADVKSETANDKREGYIDLEKLQSALEHLAIKLPAGCYEEWYRIGFALSTLDKDGEELFIKMSLASPHYNTSEDEIRKKFAELSKDYDGRVTLGTIYHLAELYGWKKPFVKFWHMDEHGKCKISKNRFKRFLEGEGFCTYKLEGARLYVRVHDKIVTEVESVDLKEFVTDYLNAMPIEECGDFTKSEVMDAVMNAATQLFGQQTLEFLIRKDIQFNEDTAESSYIYFKNGYIEVTKHEIRLREYRNMEKHIWANQIIKRNYGTTLRRSVFEEFLHNVCGGNIERFKALKSAIGFLLHKFKDPSKAKAVIFIDEKLSEGANGMSGKGLTIRALSKIRNTITEEGRNFNPGKNFAFQRVKVDTDILAFQDIGEKFPFDRLFSIITDGITVEKKNKDEFYLEYSESPKIVISTNFSIKGFDDSTLGRQFTVEFTNCYNKKHQPIDDFGKLFFHQWDDREWMEFDNLMAEYLQFYLQKGLMTYKYVNLEKKNLIGETCTEFAEFSERLELDTEYDKKDLYKDFKLEYEDFDRLTQGKFTKWLKVWARIKELEVLEPKSGSKRCILFQNPMEKRAA